MFGPGASALAAALIGLFGHKMDGKDSNKSLIYKIFFDFIGLCLKEALMPQKLPLRSFPTSATGRWHLSQTRRWSSAA